MKACFECCGRGQVRATLTFLLMTCPRCEGTGKETPRLAPIPDDMDWYEVL